MAIETFWTYSQMFGGVSWFSAEVGPKRLALLHELMHAATVFAMLVNPKCGAAACYGRFGRNRKSPLDTIRVLIRRDIVMTVLMYLLLGS
jgi:hypothetical protein